MVWRGALASLVWLVAAVLLSLPAWAEARIALVVTNQAYTQAGARLTNTHRDGDLVKTALERVGFKVWVEKDTASEGALLQAIGAHVRRLAEAGPDAVGFFYYSGHGAADRPDGANYLIPTAAPLTHVAELPLMAVRLDRITATLASAGKMSFVVFDACRNVPLLRDTKDLSFKGFAPVREQNGLLVAFATEPGNVAVDQSLYAKALAEEIVKPGLEAAQVFRRVRLRVREDTKQVQSPEYLDKRDNDFHFAATAIALPPPQTPAPQPAPARPSNPGLAVAPPARAVRPLTKAEERTLKPKDSFKECESCPEMVVLPAGEFVMGSDYGGGEEKPVRKVTIGKPLAVGRFEVTFAEWDACVADSGCKQKPDDEGWGRGNRPVMKVSWEDASREYLPWLSRKTSKTYRLLTEAEWEYAASAGSRTQYWWGDDLGRARANCKGCASQWDNNQAAPVGSFQANAFGLHDVHGNVWEWVADCYKDNYAGAPSDGRAVPEIDRCWRVLRGGSFDNEGPVIRLSSRGRNRPNLRSMSVGFRAARTFSGP